ncbi:MAG: helix-turn-helix domain-containing protein [Bacteroidota bacterium]
MEIDSKTISKIIGDITYLKQGIESLLMSKPETWLTSKQVCSRYNISTRTLADYRSKKLIPYSQVGSKVQYKQSEIEKFFERHTIHGKGG